MDNITPENQQEEDVNDAPQVKSIEAATATADGAPPPARTSLPQVPFVEDGRADLALDFVIDVLAAMGMDCTVDLLENEEEDPPEEIRLEIEGKDAGRIIGKKGQTLAALQFLANRVINRPGKQRRHVIIDAEGQGNDARVQLRDVLPQQVAVVRFSGFWSEANYNEHLAKLQAALRAADMAWTGEAVNSRYNAPFTPWFMRRNEVWLALAPRPAGG